MTDTDIPKVDVLKQYEEFGLAEPVREIIQLLEERQRSIHKQIIFPSDLEHGKVHKCVIITQRMKMMPDNYGNENRYVCFAAVGVQEGVYYKSQDMYMGKPFVLMFPALTFEAMFNYRIGAHIWTRIQKDRDELEEWPSYEIHFTKVSSRRYTLDYWALVDDDGVEYDEDSRIVYRFKRYKTIFQKQTRKQK